MVVVREVKTKREKWQFLNFPLKMYKHNPCFVPPLYSDEKKIFNDDYTYYDTCKAVYFNAYKNHHMVGRISGILQTVSNDIRKEKRIRFTRFDTVNDLEVARALTKAVEDWGRSLGMDTICGPLGFSDLEREGLLIEGFDQMSTFEEQYSADYYPRLLEACGYKKEVDWLESRLMVDENKYGQLEKISQFLQKRYHLKRIHGLPIGEFLAKYSDQMFEVLDQGYAKLYGTVPFTENMKKMILDNFSLLLDKRYVSCVVDENDKVVLMGLCLPSIGKAVQKSHGHLTPKCIYKILRSKANPKVLDLALVAVAPGYENKGFSAILCAELERLMHDSKVKYAETNLNLESNREIQDLWKQFHHVNHKRRRSYIKSL